MSEDEIRSKAKRAVDVLRKIQDFPTYSKVINFSHQELNLLLQECPESPYFAKDDFETTKEGAKRLVLGIIEGANAGALVPLPEASQSKEKSSSLLVSVDQD